MKTKIYYGRDLIGRFTCDGKVYKWYQILWIRAKYWTKFTVLSTAIIWAVGFIGFSIAKSTVKPEIVEAEKIVDVSPDMFASKIDNLKSSLVEKLRACESGGHKEADGIIIFDTNNKASVGTLQFQIKTVVYYYKTLYGKTITNKEAALIALDDEKAGELAKDIMFTSKNLADDWYNCATKLGLNKEIQVIKQLEK